MPPTWHNLLGHGWASPTLCALWDEVAIYSYHFINHAHASVTESMSIQQHMAYRASIIACKNRTACPPWHCSLCEGADWHWRKVCHWCPQAPHPLSEGGQTRAVELQADSFSYTSAINATEKPQAPILTEPSHQPPLQIGTTLLATMRFMVQPRREHQESGGMAGHSQKTSNRGPMHVGPCVAPFYLERCGHPPKAPLTQSLFVMKLLM